MAQLGKRHGRHDGIVQRIVRFALGQSQIGQQGGKAQINLDVALLVVRRQLGKLVVVVQGRDFNAPAAAGPGPGWARPRG